MTEPAGTSLERSGASSLRTNAEPQSSTTGSRRIAAARWFVIILSVANVLAAAATLMLIWNTTAKTGSPLSERINDSVWLIGSLLFAGVVFLIAWHAGDQPANLAIAVAFAFAGSSKIFWILMEQLGVNPSIRDAVETPLFTLGAGFFICAAMRFPRKLTPHDIASSRTIWGRVRPLRAVLIFFLRPVAVWVFVATTSILTGLSTNPILTSANWITIVLLGLIYFYIMYQSGDAEARRKVLWLFELTLATLVLKILWLGVDAVLHERSSESLRAVVSVLLDSARSLAQVFCICMAVFYAGAISPALVIRKTFVYGVTVALLLFAYATMEALVANLLVEKIGVSNNFANALLGTMLALAFHPIKNRMEHALRRFSTRPAPVPPAEAS